MPPVSASPAHGESGQRGDGKAGVQEVPRGTNHRDGGLQDTAKARGQQCRPQNAGLRTYVER